MAQQSKVGDDVESGGKGTAGCPSYDTRDDHLYLLEFTGATGTAPRLADRGGGVRPAGGAAVALSVNRAIGGWNIGNWALSLNKALSTYVLDIKVTAGGHEGSVNLAVDRGTWVHNAPLSNGWSCGTGHTEANRLFYNAALDRWARLCWTDTLPKWSTYFQTLPAAALGTSPKVLMELPGGR